MNIAATRAYGARRGMRSQSAMEYLMTYGWAILVIAVILGVLFQLGVFGSANLAPKAKAGQCQVQIVGSGSSTTHQLAGLCSPELPQYVAQFNGQNLFIGIPANDMFNNINSAQAITISIWYDMYSLPSSWVDIISIPNLNSVAIQTDGSEALSFWASNALNTHVPVSSAGAAYNPLNKWNNIIFTIAGSSCTVYFDGVVYSSGCGGTFSGPFAISQFAQIYLNDGNFGDTFWPGEIANVQIYNASLSSTEASALYQEGIGGTPVKPQNIVGWWPLNGNENDYSGNNNNGQPTGIEFASFWTSGYTAP